MNRGDVIQITDKAHPWYPALLIVDDVVSYGVVAHVVIPKKCTDPKAGGLAYNLVPNDAFQAVGPAAVIMRDEDL